VRKRALLAFSLPLAAVGTLAGHAAGYAVAGMSHRDAAVHGYLNFAPQFLGICLAALGLALVLRVSGRLQGRPAAWPFALIPPLAFLAQELIERLAAGLPAHALLEPAVYVGLAAQVPIAVAGFMVARALLRVADEAARALAPRLAFGLRPAPATIPAVVFTPASSSDTPRRPGRSPPR
jgi:hypothetical protein